MWSPTGRYFGFADTGVTQSSGLRSIYLLSQEKVGGSYDTILVEGGGFEPLWSPSGNLLLYSVFTQQNNWNPNLYIIETESGNVGSRKINLNLSTWTNKCVFSNDGSVLYCGVPSELKEGYGLVPEIADEIPDEIVKINISTGVKDVLAVPDESITIDKIFLSDDQNELILHDKNTNGLKKIKLR